MAGFFEANFYNFHKSIAICENVTLCGPNLVTVHVTTPAFKNAVHATKRLHEINVTNYYIH